MTDKEYNITGTLTIDFDFDINEYKFVSNREEAIFEAKQLIEDYFKLKAIGHGLFNPESDVKLDLDADEIYYEEE